MSGTTPAYPPAEPVAATASTAPAPAVSPAVSPATATKPSGIAHFDSILNGAAKTIETATAAPETATALATVQPALNKAAKVRGVLYEVQKGLGAVVAIAPAVLAFTTGDVKDLGASALGVVIAGYGYLAKANLSSN